MRSRPDQQAEQRKESHRRQHRHPRFVRMKRAGTAGSAEEYRAVQLGKGDHSQSADQRQQRGQQHQIDQAARLKLPEKTEIQEEFADKTVQGGDTADCNRSDQKEECDTRHPFAESPHQVHLTRSGGMDNGPGAEEQQRLEEAVIENMEQGARHAEIHQRIIVA